MVSSDQGVNWEFRNNGPLLASTYIQGVYQSIEGTANVGYITFENSGSITIAKGGELTHTDNVTATFQKGISVWHDGKDWAVATIEAAMGELPVNFKAVEDGTYMFSTQVPDPVEESDQPFAYISNGEIIVNGEGMLQVIDMMGRVIVSRDAARHVSTNGIAPGVYVLLLETFVHFDTPAVLVQDAS